MKARLFIAFALGLLAGVSVKHFWPQQTTRQETRLPQLPETGSQLRFADLLASTAKPLIPFDNTNPIHCEISEAIQQAAEELRQAMSQDNAPVRQARRINEASRYFEDGLRDLLDRDPRFRCRPPLTQQGKAQRSGYPDLELTHLDSGLTTYLDPKLFRSDTIDSTFRTFYYEPTTHSKVTHPALHFLIGFAHDGQTGAWTFSQVHLVDLSNLTVIFKAEFSASNREIYQTH